jgi:hypothetical protein
MLAFIDIESRIALDHPLRTIRHVADTALTELSPVFDQMYVNDGPALDSTGAVVESFVVDESVLHPQRAGLL